MAPKYSLVIPTHDDSGDFARLWANAGPQLGQAWEAIVVNDGSAAAHANALAGLARGATPFRLHSLPKQEGRFVARLRGAEAAAGEFLAFCDTRVTLPSGLLRRVELLLPSHPALMARISIDPAESAYSLYWELSHRWFFASHYETEHQATILTPQNFESMLKGTTFLVVERRLFLEACAGFASAPENDDTPLLLEIVKKQPITIHPEVTVGWRPRQRLIPFALRLGRRAPGFVEYYFRRRGTKLHRWLWAGFLAGNALLIAGLAFPPLFLLGALLFLAAGAWQCRKMAGKRARKILPLHLASVLSFGLGVYMLTWRRILLSCLPG